MIAGNRAWQAAAQVRHRWLTSSFFPRKTLPREAQVFLARQLLAMPDPLRTGLATATAKTLFTRLTGHDVGTWREACDTAPTGRLAVIMLAPVITAYEYAMTEAEGRNTWRTDRYSPCPRRDAGTYLTFLAAIGYQLSAIEQAVADGTPYAGDVTPATLPAVELARRSPGRRLRHQQRRPAQLATTRARSAPRRTPQPDRRDPCGAAEIPRRPRATLVASPATQEPRRAASPGPAAPDAAIPSLRTYIRIEALL